MNPTEVAQDNHGANTHLRPPRQSTLARSSSITSSIASIREDISSSKKWRHRWRHMLGIILLLATVFLWTASNFLASTIFADDTYSKPYFVTYTNSAFFMIPLPPILLWIAIKDPAQFAELRNLLRNPVRQYSLLPSGEDLDSSMKLDEPSNNPISRSGSPSNPVGVDDTATFARNVQGSTMKDKYTLVETAKLSFFFCFLWLLANYFAAACLEYTTVASATILSATSSIWTLLFGTLLAVERFTVRKLVGVLASLAGIILISSVDMSGETDKNRGTFPHKTPSEIGIGDILAFVSAVIYGIYAVVIKKRLGDEGRVNMPLFFGLVGLMTVLLLWPVFIILHFTGIETFELPPDSRVTMIVLLNSATSLVSDFCWAYALLFTSPLLVTVGLSLTIPLSLVGQMVLDHQYSSALYWIGACVVLLSFIFINHEESKEEEATQVERGDGDGVSFGGAHPAI